MRLNAPKHKLLPRLELDKTLRAISALEIGRAEADETAVTKLRANRAQQLPPRLRPQRGNTNGAHVPQHVGGECSEQK